MGPARSASFESAGERCEADLYLPDAGPAPPVVVMAHGFGLDRRAGLQRYAQRFVEAGLAVLVFDHRGFGGSSGTPRQLVDPFHHRGDWLAAVDHAGTIPEVDGDRIAVWGTSLSAGHAIEAAARREVAAVAVQVPFVDGVATLGHLFSELGPGYFARAIGEGLLDVGRSAIGQAPRTVPIVGPPDRFALLGTREAEDGYAALVDPDSGWENACPARVGLLVPAYHPIRRAGDVDAPALVVVANRDRLLPASAGVRLAHQLDRARLLTLDAGHFDVYEAPLFEPLVDLQARFLLRALTR